MRMEVKQLMKDKKVWFASFLVAWAAALQMHMTWLQKKESFKEKFGAPSASDQPNEGDLN